jgi:uncharacterized protein YdhG (YjbR/CyaY superfamily)
MAVMNKAKSPRRDAAARARGTPKNFAEYYAGVPTPARGALQKMRAAIRSAVPKEATEVISYGIPAFKTTKVLIWFAGFASHCSLFPTAAVIAVFNRELKPYSCSKGTIQFPLDKPLPIPLIKKIAKARVAQLKSRPSS